MKRRVQVIINPASGQDEPVLAVLNRVFTDFDISWEVSVTQPELDAFELTRRALEKKPDVIAAYGGDGTISAVASALRDTSIPLGILPGGTGNAIAQELSIPQELEESARILCREHLPVESVDLMRSRDQCFLLRIGIGADALTVTMAEREQKDRLGWMAYFVSALRQLKDPPMAHYRVTVDGEVTATEAVTCIVANIGRLGRGGIRFANNIDPTDGLVDILLLKDTNLRAMMSLGASVLGLQPDEAEGESEPLFEQFRGRDISIRCDPEQPAHGDGDLLEKTPIDITVQKAALSVIVPSQGSNTD